MIVIAETCCCGARFQYTGSSDVAAGFRRKEFATEHKICRERERALVMWGGDQA